MVGQRGDFASVGRFAAGLGGCLTLAACVTDRSELVTAKAPLFRADAGGVSGGLAPGPNAVWYVPREPVRFVKIGVAAWGPDHRRAGWLSRLFRLAPAREADAEPTALAAAGLALPTPSRVQVTNLTTGRMVTLRVEDNARLAGAIVQLPASIAGDLGADPRQPLMVRVRYLAPLMAYEGRAPLRYARQAPTPARAAEPVRLAAVAAPRAAEVGPPPKARPAADIDRALRGAQPAPPTPEAPDEVFRVQAGAFASRANAERAADRLEAAGATTIEPLQRGPRTLYRVVVAGSQTGREAERLRERVVRAGFPDAWILKPL